MPYIPTPSLLKSDDSDIREALEMAFVYLQAYKDTGDWGYLPTVTNCVDKIGRIHMIRANKLLKGDKDGTQGRS